MAHAEEYESLNLSFVLSRAMDFDVPIDTEIHIEGLDTSGKLNAEQSALRERDRVVVPLMIEVDQPVSAVMEFFDADLGASDPVVIWDSDQVVATLTMESLASLVMRTDPAPMESEAILGWFGRTGIHWCVRGRHSTTTWPCPRHGD